MNVIEDAGAQAPAIAISGTVIDDLSGSYKTFEECVKELIANAYDADATQVVLRIDCDHRSLTVSDDGAGMNPRQLVMDYMRIGRNAEAKRFSPSGVRERIGGKGIGSLSPARYCGYLTVRTKSAVPMTDSIVLDVPGDGLVPVNRIFPYVALAQEHLHLLSDLSWELEGEEGVEPRLVPPSPVIALPPGRRCRIRYTFAAERVWLKATIDFTAFRAYGEQTDLAQVSSLWNVRLEAAHPGEYRSSGTTIEMDPLEDFVVRRLNAPAKRGRNIEAKSGLEHFLWQLARLCPVPVHNPGGLIAQRYPADAAQMLLYPPQTLPVYVDTGHDRSQQTILALSCRRIERQVYCPERAIEGNLRSLYRTVDFDGEDGLRVRGYLLGSPTAIHPGELRGISIRVKGVELGAPNWFGAEACVSGPAHVALTNHITGELHVEGVDARRDILPGREGLYPESPVFRAIRRVLVGTEDGLGGLLKDLVAEILRHSEVTSSAKALLKRLDAQRTAFLDAAGAIAVMAANNDRLWERLMAHRPADGELMLAEPVQIRPEGALRAFAVEFADMPANVPYQVDMGTRILTLPASRLTQMLDIAGEVFRINLCHGRHSRLCYEVDADARQFFINWDHPLRGALGDAVFIKHCLASAVIGLPQDSLSQYLALVIAR